MCSFVVAGVLFSSRLGRGFGRCGFGSRSRSGRRILGCGQAGLTGTLRGSGLGACGVLCGAVLCLFLGRAARQNRCGLWLGLAVNDALRGAAALALDDGVGDDPRHQQPRADRVVRCPG